MSVSSPKTSFNTTTTSSSNSTDSISHKLTSKTTIFSLKLYALIAILSTIFVLLLLLLVLLLRRTSRSRSRSRDRRTRVKHSSGSIPFVSKEIAEVIEAEKLESTIENAGHDDDDDVERGEGNSSSNRKKGSGGDVAGGGEVSVVEENIGWGKWYSLRELEIATRGFAEENVIGEGGYGVVYRGVLLDSSVVAVKNLLNNK